MEDDCQVERGEIDCQQGLRMTAGWGGGNFTSIMGGNDCWVRKGEFDWQKGWK